MRRVLVTGMSGTGKSTALAELGRRGFHVVDTDERPCHLAEVEPLLRATCTHEIDATQPIAGVVSKLVEIGVGTNISVPRDV